MDVGVGSQECFLLLPLRKFNVNVLSVNGDIFTSPCDVFGSFQELKSRTSVKRIRIYDKTNVLCCDLSTLKFQSSVCKSYLNTLALNNVSKYKLQDIGKIFDLNEKHAYY